MFISDKIPALVKAFSARANSRTLFRIVPTNSNPNIIECLHGIRCMSLFWVIFSHEFIYALTSPNLNKADIYSVCISNDAKMYSLLLKTKIFQWAVEPFASFVLHGYFTVDSFFVLGGLLVSMIALRSMEK